MASAQIDLFGPKAGQHWYETYRQLRETAPVYQVPGTTLYVLTRYDDIAMVVRDSERFSTEADRHGGEPLLLHPEAREIYRQRGWPKAFPLSQDPPEHRRFRALVNPFFAGGQLERSRAMIKRRVAALIDQFADAGRVEFVAGFAVPLPAAVIGDLLGLPEADQPRLAEWSYAWALPFARGLSRDQEIWVAEKGVEFQQYLKGWIDRRRAEPADDIISELAQARLDDRALDDGEIVQILDHLYIGGNETTAYALASGIWIMLREPLIHAALCADRSRIKGFVEEVLRLESPTQGLYRTTTRDAEIRGVAIPRGATLHLRFAAANRDPAVFEEPDAVRLDRPNAMRHMAFSQAEHHCPGSGLSRLELQIAFNALINRLPNLRLDPLCNTYEHQPGFVLRALKELWLEFDLG
ncbi:cytochrome P450 [Novosphingobium sp. Gsoil 351]|uniref:cytochrome P450 n=1 Tax=Novosphingobium sp. Gsoil 351 TaxID=2675225 RepID=UPI0012B4D1A3|nr:cytochrome P450 [Novosphingobium sp. Gsoil 351]QGN55683.1 cytochrome P450 [Novosphingobium sp. Gsoil 351]